ncbi:MAG: ATP-binding protein [Candidatus Omnitrophota bacterium]
MIYFCNMKIGYNKHTILFFLTVITSACVAFCAFAEDVDSVVASQAIIKHYRDILKTTTDSAKSANAHFEIGLALEKLGNEEEATGEYLKIIINYPEIDEVNRKAEERLAGLYKGFSAQSDDIMERSETAGEQKDPTIFFAYIKSLYENYISLGQYDRALHALQKLYVMDPENESYLVDIGNIYLYGYNDADKAISHFKKALSVKPDSPQAHVDLGRSYEKTDDYENAVRAYSKAAEISPASPWSMYGLKRIDGIRLAKDKRLIRDWYVLGPFDNADKKALEKPFPPEDKIDLKATIPGKDGIFVRWIRPFDYEDSGYVDLNSLISPHDYAVAYALTYVHSRSERTVQLGLGSDAGIRVWVNDQIVFTHDVERSAEVDDDLVKVSLRKGWNKILLKVSETWGSWGFYFRVMDLKNNPVDNLVFDPKRDQDRLGQIYGRMKKARSLKITRIVLIYTGAISIFLSGLYFLISNIYNKIKINKMKEDFVSSVSHELKTPIAAVKMLAETLKRGKVKTEDRKDQYYEMIMREADRLTRFINKILDFSKLEKGAKIFYFEKTDIVGLARMAVDIFTDETQDKDLKLEATGEKDIIFADVDKDAILQVFLNLVDNAYKYSRTEKDIRISVKEVKTDVHIEISDKGLGIPKDKIEKIFEKFFRIERDIAQGSKGSGLGLAFVKSIINAHSGKIAVQSELGKGSKFVISLPIERA